MKPYLITPYRTTNADDVRKKQFNTKHSSTRNIVERTFGILKNRFRCILGARQLHYSPKKAAQIINVVCALHNLCIKHKIQVEEPFVDNIEPEGIVSYENESQDNLEATHIRNNIMDSIC